MVPQKSKERALVVAISGLDEKKTMPPKRRPGRDRPQGGPGGPGGSKMPKALTAEEVGRVRAWIDQGAK